MYITARPFLYIDLQKSTTWKESVHPRDKFGKFRSIKSGSSIVTSTGKTGKVESVTDEHYNVRYEDGKKGKVKKGNVIHSEDLKQIQAATKKRKKTAAKSKATKDTTKANGHGKGQVLEVPAAKAKTKAATKTKTVKATPKVEAKTAAKPKVAAKTKTATPTTPVKTKVTAKTKAATPTTPVKTKVAAKTKAAPKSKKKTKVIPPAPKASDPIFDASSNSRGNVAEKTKTVPIKSAGKRSKDPMEDKQNQELKTYTNMEKDRDTTTDIDAMWKSKAVQRLMNKAPEKRAEADIRNLAGDITTKNDKLARYTTLQMGKARGLNLLMQQNKIGDVGQNGNGEVINQETGYYGDLLQAARTSMYETLYKVMKGSQNPKEGGSIGAHVVSRMKQKLHGDIYNLMNDVPAPHEIRSAIGDMEKSKKQLQQLLGAEPTERELAHHLQTNSKHFREAPIMDHPTYDEKSGQWLATKKRIEDPVERLRALNTYSSQQKASSMDQDRSDEGENEVNIGTGLKDTDLTPDEAYERKERQKELKSAIPEALNSLGLNEKEKMVFTTMFGNPSAKVKRGNLTMDETADIINAAGGYEGGKQANKMWVNKYYRSAMDKIIAARKANHPALESLQSNFMKSLFFNLVFKSMYEYDLVKSMNSWGINVDTLHTEYTRSTSAANLLSLRKSLAPYEYIGSVVTTDTGEIHARIVEYAMPEDTMLYKSFQESMTSLKKSMFPHKGKSNHEVNSKAADYVKANKKKYDTLSETQHAAAKAKKGDLTWSEKLLLDNAGSAWLSWGGKRILIAVGDGKVLYDSSNEAHREAYNNSASSEKIDFQYEKDELAKQGLEDTEENRSKLDQGVQAFKEQMAEMQNDWKTNIQPKLKDEHGHRVGYAYKKLTEAQRKELDEAEDKDYTLGKHIYGWHKEAIDAGAKELQDKVKAIKADSSLNKKEQGAATKAARLEFALKMQAVGKKDSNAMANKEKMLALASEAIKVTDESESIAQAALARYLGSADISRGKEDVSKRLLPEGASMIGNPITGKTMVVKIKNGFGTGGTKTGWTSTIVEAFDPDGGSHEELTSWGALGRALGLDANDIQQTIATNCNTTEDKPFMKPISDADYNKMRSGTKLGLQETMAHKDFKLVDQQRDKDNNITRSTYAQDMEDGTQNVFSVNDKGYITDPVMARLIAQRKPITGIDDLHDVLKNAVGNRAWVTAHFGSDIHSGDALGHHVQLEYDGKGAPRVVGGVYDGYRFIDTRDIPKNSIDPATGEPIKALFKNGKLVGRGLTTKNDVEMKQGNPVMYKDGDRYKKGRIHSIEGDNYKITDGKGHVIGMFKKDQLKPARVDGKTNSKSGQAVVKLANNGTHRANTEDMFKATNPKDQKKLDKAKDLFSQALTKSGVNRAFDHEGNLNRDLELSDANMNKLKKVLGRSKAGRELLSKFKSAYTKELELHVPDNLRAQVEAEGVTVGANGTARISVGKFEELRDILGGLSIDSKARKHLEGYFNSKDRRPMDERMPEIIKNYDPRSVDESTAFGKAYKAQFKTDGFIMDKTKGLYGVQLQGVTHLVERGRGIVGHGIK